MKVYLLKTRDRYEGEIEVHGVFSSVKKGDEYVEFLRKKYPHAGYGAEDCVVIYDEFELDRGELEG